MRKVVLKVICERCGQEISKSNYSKHLRRHENHPETFKDYSYALTHDGLDCQYCGKTCKNRNSLCNHERLCKENPNKQATNLTKYFTKGHEAWNKGKTKETDNRVAINAENLRLYYKYNSSNRIGIPLSQEHKNKISKTILEKSCSGEWHTSLARKMHFNYNGIDLHGTWEVAYATYLDEHNIKWERCKKRFSYHYEGKLHYYTPDFYLIDEDVYVEVKGFKTDKDTSKWNQFPKTETLKILFAEDLKLLGISIKT